MKDAYERRALLLHLGDVLEALSCLSRGGQRYATLGDAIAREDSLATFTWLGYLDAAMTPQQVNERATAAFFLWPKTLLDEDLNRSLLASTVQHDLFAGQRRRVGALCQGAQNRCGVVCGRFAGTVRRSQRRNRDLAAGPSRQRPGHPEA